MKYNLFIGRYQSPHIGHMHIFNKYLKEQKPILIAIRDVAPDDANPLFAADVKELWERVYKDNPLVKVIIIPDISSVNYGRGVGYEVVEIKVDESVANISATEIRNQIIEGRSEWHDHVDSSIHQLLAQKIKERILNHNYLNI
jgi:nicotinamide mononucleotide adenylyltransferase